MQAKQKVAVLEAVSKTLRLSKSRSHGLVLEDGYVNFGTLSKALAEIPTTQSVDGIVLGVKASGKRQVVAVAIPSDVALKIGDKVQISIEQ